MRLYKKGRLLQLISIFCALAIIGSIIPLGLLTEANSVSDPTVYTNNYEESLLGSFIAKNGMTGTVEYGLFKENDNTVMKYDSTGMYEQTYINGIYMPDTITQENLDGYTWSYPFVAKAKSGKNYLSVSFRYKIVSFDSDCSQAVFKLATFNAANAYSNINARETLAVATTTGEWVSVNAIVEFDATGVDWQSNGLGIGVYDTRGELYIDDVVIKDYSATNAIYASFNTLGGDAIEGAIINSSDGLPIAQKENEEFVGWYIDSGLTNAFDFDSYDRNQNGFKVTLYAKYNSSVSTGPAPIVYRNSYEEALLGSFIAKNGMTSTVEYGLFKENDNTVMKYDSTGMYGQTYINGIYMPDTITQENLDGYTWSYPFVAKAKSGKNYLSVSFRYKIVSFDSDCSQAVFKLATFNAANSYSNINARETLAVATTIGEWTTVNAIINVDCTGVDWQNDGLGIGVYDTRGELYIDDVVIKDYTETNLLYVTYDTGDGDAIASGFVGASDQLPAATKSDAEFLGWYLDSNYENSFDFDAYDREQKGFKVTLYAKFKSLIDDSDTPIVYNNTFEDRAPTIKYNAFTTETFSDGNTALKYSLKREDDYWTTWNYCAFYDNVNGKDYIDNGANTVIYKVSFRYKVDSVDDGSAISFGLGISHFGNIWANSEFFKAINSSNTTNDWVDVETNVAIVSPDDWQIRAISLAVKGQGVAYIDDIEIVKYTDPEALYVSFDTNGGDLIESSIITPVDTLPTAVRGNAEFIGWYLDSEFNEAFDINTYDYTTRGKIVILYACFEDSHAGSKIYTNTFEENYVSSIYSNAKMYNSFSFTKEGNQNTLLKFSLAYGDAYDYTPNYVALYDNTNNKILVNGTRKALYRISFRYKVDSLGKDSGSISVALSSMHTDNCWADGKYSSKELLKSSVTDGWQEFTGCAIINTKDAHWQEKGLGLALTGRGIMYIDDIVIEDLTDTKGLLINFDTYGGDSIVSNVYFPEDELPKATYGSEEFVKWYADSEFSKPFVFGEYDRDANGFEITLYAKYKNLGPEIIEPTIHKIDFDQDFVDSLYDGKNKSDSFDFDEIGRGKTLLYNQTTPSDNNAILLYNQNGDLLKVESKQRIYRITFQYKVESLGVDTDVLTVGIGLSNTENFRNLDKVCNTLMFSGVNDDWQEFSLDLSLDASGKENQVLALLVSGSGVMLIDDIVIRDYTETNAILMNFNTNNGTLLKERIVEKKSDMPTPQKEGCVFKGWFTDEELVNYFDFYEYKPSVSGNVLKVYANFSNLIGGYEPLEYHNNFEENYLDSVYVERTKYNSFNIVRMQSGNKALQYLMNVGDDYDYSVSFCSLYNNIKKTVLSNGRRFAFYRVSFRYKVESLVADCNSINIAVSSMHTGNCWANGAFDGIEVASSGVTEGWIFCEQYVAIDTSDAHWQEQGLGLRVSGRGVAYIDDISIEDYTNSNLNGFFLVTSGGETLEPLIGEIGTTVAIPQIVSKSKNEFNGWYTDRRCNNKFDGNAVITKGLTPLYVNWKQETIEYQKFEPKEEEKEDYTYTALYKGGKLNETNSIKDGDADESDNETDNETNTNKTKRKKKIIKRIVYSSYFSTPMIIGISIGGVVIVAAVVVLIIFIRRKKRGVTK